MLNDDPAAMAKRIEAQLERNGGGVVLLHDIRPATLPTLKLVLAYLYDRKWSPRRPERYGYRIVDLPTYLARPRPRRVRTRTVEELENARREASRLRRPQKRARPASPRKGRPRALAGWCFWYPKNPIRIERSSPRRGSPKNDVLLGGERREPLPDEQERRSLVFEKHQAPEPRSKPCRSPGTSAGACSARRCT